MANSEDISPKFRIRKGRGVLAMSEMFAQHELDERVNVDITFFRTGPAVLTKLLLVKAKSRDSEPITRHDIAYILGMTYAANELWQPSGVIYDCRELMYRGGDTMSLLFSKFPRERISPVLAAALGIVEIPKVCIVSQLNRDKFTSLCRCELNIDPDKVLFETVD